MAKRIPEANITLVYCEDGDWVALYINGNLARQKESIQEDDLVELLLGYHIVSNKALQRPLEAGKRFPERLADLPPNPRELLGNWNSG